MVMNQQEHGGQAPADGRAATLSSRSSSITTGWRPGTIALRDAWFPIAHTRFLGKRPLRRALHSLPVYLYRSRDGLLATDRHPTARQSLDFPVTEFTTAGRYPLVERYGYAWVWYGDPRTADPALIPDIPFLPVDGRLPRRWMGSIVFDSTYELVCENLLDLTHADFLHTAITGDALSDEDVITVKSTSETVTMTRTAKNRRIPNVQRFLGAKGDRQDVTIVTHIHVRSGACLVHATWRPGMEIRMFHPVVPESSVRSRTCVSFNLRCENPLLLRALFGLASHIVGSQDNRALLVQNPRYVTVDSQDVDLSSRFDTAGLRYRKVFQELAERQRRRDYAYLPDGDPASDARELLHL
jgi:Vanillate O-demethylase oxygenase C-terminal domain